ncbi:phosphoribosylformylglycinamidine synthase subunit II [Oceanithermus profundus DSM 14977]|uniref:Multifunctional fusion protein n=1 Tax=Oceanithermus profundus (strain DSM 14977 / NBRC 100410 / VKM B-2274 / 506) TaxID=670487 RepID=E4U458_OCEP5|nr:phosphoribosylformylglycinamidine synthase I [Oceanithermus profundus]ADR36143.1 phosphoribosylformylglycinamidine synthase subunit II [Oceanithermus profundus DSM 14977]
MNRSQGEELQATFVVEVTGVRGGADAELRARELGARAVRRARLFYLQGLDRAQVEALAREVLADAVSERWRVAPAGAPPELEPGWTYVDVTLHPGVTDAEAETLLAVLAARGLTGVRAATGRRYYVQGLDPARLAELAPRTLANPVVEHWSVAAPARPGFVEAEPARMEARRLPLRNLDEAGLAALSRARRLALDVSEMKQIQAYFVREGREPTDVELETLAQSWSEHCAHKTFRSPIVYTGPPPGSRSGAETRRIDGLLRTYIKGATDRLDRPWVRSAIEDNAGLVAFAEGYDLAFKVETHNHPSALEPFGGAGTGVGGVIRDVLGVSARPLAVTDVLCFGPLDLPAEDLPEGALHPRRVYEGVTHGIEDYGNKMGVPTVSGAVWFHPGYTANPLVYAGCLGVLPSGSHPTEPRAGDWVVLVGGRTGRDGIGGATFSSATMDATTHEVAGASVQIGDPIQEKKVADLVLAARDEGLYHAITDCGAGGLSSAVGEMGAALGVRVELERVPLKYPGLEPWEIWLSEAQERMVLAVPPDRWERLAELARRYRVEAVRIGRFEASGRLVVEAGGRAVADLAMDFVHGGWPRRERRAEWRPPRLARARFEPGPELLPALLAHPNLKSREPLLRRYDHLVQGGTAEGPLVGAADHGPADAAVLVPQEVQGADPPAAALAVGLATGLYPVDPYLMAFMALDEAVRNLVAVGADPDRIAVLDNFSWGDPDLPDRLGSLVRAAQGLYDAALRYGTPFVSGKDSLNNEYTDRRGVRHAIPGTLVVSGLGRLARASEAQSLDLKRPGDPVWLVGATGRALAGSHAGALAGLPETAGGLPVFDERAPDWMRALHRAIRSGWVRAVHDLSEGGLALAAAEMAIAGRLGLDLDPARAPVIEPLGEAELLFSESPSRFLVEVDAEHEAAFAALFEGLPAARLGRVTPEPELRLGGWRWPLEELERAWRGELAPDPRPIRPAPEPYAAAAVRRARPRAAVLFAPGTNRDGDARIALERAGARPERVLLSELEPADLAAFDLLLLPGGFSYGDDLGAGKVWALELRDRFGEAVDAFVASGKPVLGICNGFQALVKAGFLPGWAGPPAVTLAPNASGRFETRWVWLEPEPGAACPFVAGLSAPLYVPVAHGEGRLAVRDAKVLARLEAAGQVALRYALPGGGEPGYPADPNGSAGHVAGLCNPAGNVLGLMPHPEDHVFPWQHPRSHRGERGFDGLALFRRLVEHA